MSIFLAMYGDKVNIFEALFISGFAMFVVFVVLLIISYLIDITAFFINKKNVAPNTVSLASDNKVSSDVSTIKEDDGKLVAIIAAAISSYLGTSSDNIRITKIRRIKQNDSSWLKQKFI